MPTVYSCSRRALASFLITPGRCTANSGQAVLTSASPKGLNDRIEVQPLKVEHIESARTTITDAFENDPMKLYLEDTPDAKKPSKWQSAILVRLLKISLAYAIETMTTFTIDEGNAVVFAATPEQRKRKPSLTERFFVYLFRSYTASGSSPEQKKRTQELKDKVAVVKKEKLGDLEEEMITLDLLATSPQYQGRGYGSALVKQITDIADTRDRDVVLFSSNIANVPFYNGLGFKTVGEVILGNDNPTYEEAPVIVCLMVRKARDYTVELKSPTLV